MFTHYVKHSDMYLAWSSCHCSATKSHYPGEYHPSLPLGFYMTLRKDSAMTPIQTRELVKAAYPSASWKDKVKRMSDRQVLAVYFRLKKEGTIK